MTKAAFWRVFPCCSVVTILEEKEKAGGMMVVKKWHGGHDDAVDDVNDDVDKGDGLYYFQTTNQWFDIFKNSRGNCFDSKFKFHCNPSLLLVCHNFAHFFV